jgi:hypothetical protein
VHSVAPKSGEAEPSRWRTEYRLLTAVCLFGIVLILTACGPSESFYVEAGDITHDSNGRMELTVFVTNQSEEAALPECWVVVMDKAGDELGAGKVKATEEVPPGDTHVLSAHVEREPGTPYQLRAECVGSG